jgi:predicted RecA/RadA family phage recombinase
VVAPPSPVNVPLKPVVSVPASAPEVNTKTGTSIVKTPPPKETARITVKPNLPTPAVRPVGNIPVAKPAPVGMGGAVPVAAAAVAGAAIAPKPAGKPATTIVKGVATAPRPAATVVKPTTAPAVATSPTQFQEEGSTTLTTVLAGLLAVLTWGTAGVLLASYYQLI